MIIRDKRTELLAPAGSLQSVYAAVNAGCDAVYMGGRKFGARAYAESAESESEDMVAEAIRYCHLFGVKLYMTINILFKDSELKELFSYMKTYYDLGVDGLIVQDLGAFRKLHEWFPDLELHASTQLTITGPEGAKLVRDMGMTRAVLARELSLKEIREIYDEAGIELEVFVHGAMCYSYSGACFMSSLIGGRSGNRGRCAGTCRLCYSMAGKKAYYLSMKDMSTIDLLPELIKAGAYSFKIEGRMKSPVYTAGVVSVYRKYLDMAMNDPEHYHVDNRDRDILNAVFDRGGVTTYLDKHNDKSMIALEEKKFRKENEEITGELKKKFIDTNRQIPLSAKLTMKAGDKASLIFYDETGVTGYAESEADVDKASSRPLDREELRKRIGKTGGTAFRLDTLEMDVNDDVFMSVSALNKLRRDALNMYEEAKLDGSKRS